MRKTMTEMAMRSDASGAGDRSPDGSPAIETELDEAFRILGQTSVVGEELEKPEETAWLDGLAAAAGQPDRLGDLAIYRALAISQAAGMRALTESEANELVRLLNVRVGLALGVASGEVVECRREDGFYIYLPGPNVAVNGDEVVAPYQALSPNEASTTGGSTSGGRS